MQRSSLNRGRTQRREKIFRLTELADNAFGNISYAEVLLVCARVQRRRINNRLGRQRNSRNHNERVYRARLIFLSRAQHIHPCSRALRPGIPFQTHIALITAALLIYLWFRSLCIPSGKKWECKRVLFYAPPNFCIPKHLSCVCAQRANLGCFWLFLLGTLWCVRFFILKEHTHICGHRTKLYIPPSGALTIFLRTATQIVLRAQNVEILSFLLLLTVCFYILNT